MRYNQLTQEERYLIYSEKKSGLSISAIAKSLGRHKSTISRELKRNSGMKGYRPKQAQHKHVSRRICNARRITEATWQSVYAKLRQQWSPEQIAHFYPVSHERIYLRIYEDKRAGGTLWQHLRQGNKKRQKRLNRKDRRGVIANRRSIEERPNVVEQRARIGDWEVDTIIGKNHKQALVSLVDRKSRFTLLAKVPYKTKELVSQAIIRLLTPNAERCQTITADNGLEFAGHQGVSEQLNVDFFFANPYASWERGTNENTNGLIRQYFPKGSDFRQIKDEDIAFREERLNNRPFKVLGFKTHKECVF